MPLVFAADPMPFRSVADRRDTENAILQCSVRTVATPSPDTWLPWLRLASELAAQAAIEYRNPEPTLVPVPCVVADPRAEHKHPHLPLTRPPRVLLPRRQNGQGQGENGEAPHRVGRKPRARRKGRGARQGRGGRAVRKGHGDRGPQEQDRADGAGYREEREEGRRDHQPLPDRREGPAGHERPAAQDPDAREGGGRQGGPDRQAQVPDRHARPGGGPDRRAEAENRAARVESGGQGCADRETQGAVAVQGRGRERDGGAEAQDRAAGAGSGIARRDDRESQVGQGGRGEGFEPGGEPTAQDRAAGGGPGEEGEGGQGFLGQGPGARALGRDGRAQGGAAGEGAREAGKGQRGARGQAGRGQEGARGHAQGARGPVGAGGIYPIRGGPLLPFH